jgi:dipeptidyl aminopeptidase/acylaminoacyl peptidase
MSPPPQREAWSHPPRYVVRGNVRRPSYRAAASAAAARTPAPCSSIWPDFANERDAILERRSAIRWADKIQTPLLIMHGGADESVDPTHALKLAIALQQVHREYQLIIFAGDDHVLAANSDERDRQAIRWFRSHLTE